MEKEYLNSLKKIDTHELATSIINQLQINEVADNYHSKAISIAYVLYQASLDSNVCIDSEEEFEASFAIPDSIKTILRSNISDIWCIVKEMKDKYPTDQLIAFILCNNDVEDFRTSECTTPSCVNELVCSILDIKGNDRVLELCSGKGTFLVETFSQQDDFEYTGVELNYVSNEIAIIRAKILEKSINVLLGDALEYRANEKADKLFANYPFMLRTPAMNEHRENIRKEFNMASDVVQRASSDWVFNATLVEQMSPNGKAVAIMTNGAAWNTPDVKMRKYFIENGYIEAVIALPSNLFKDTGIATTLIVFSHNNKQIRMVDARDICVRERRLNIITKDNIDKILSLLGEDSEKSITKPISEFADNDFVLNVTRYLENIPEFSNGVEFGSVVKNVTRGTQLKADDLNEKKSSEPTPYKYLMLSNINDGIISIDDEQYLKDIPENLRKFCVKNNAIVFTKSGMPIKSAIAQVEKDTELLATGNFFVVELDEEKVNPFYAQAFFASEIGIALLRSICAGSVLPTISLDKLKKLIIPLPSIEEQNTIGNKYAAAMDEVILLKRKLAKSVERMKHIYDEEV